MRLRAMMWIAAGAMLVSVALPQRLEAQARELGSPAEGTVPGEGAAPTGSAPRDPAGARPPAGYESVEVPPPPGTEAGIRYPGQQAPRARALTTDAGVRIPSGMATRLRALDSDFQVLAARGGGSIVDGILGILTGGLSITVGILLINEPAGAGGLNMSPYLFTIGGTSAVRGVLSLVLMTNPSGPAIAFAHMPMTTMDEVRARLEYGERELAGLADRSRISRILDGSLNVVAGLAIIPIYLAPNNFEIVQEFDWFVLIASGISAISGVITLLSTTEAERRWSAYSELRDRLEARGEDTRGARQPEGARGEAVRDEPQDRDEVDLSIRESAPDGATILPMAGGFQGGGIVGVQGTF